MDYMINGQKYIITNSELLIFLLFTIWSYCWKIPAVWKSVKNENKKWFIVFIFINTLGILEIAYLMYFSDRPKSKD